MKAGGLQNAVEAALHQKPSQSHQGRFRGFLSLVGSKQSEFLARAIRIIPQVSQGYVLALFWLLLAFAVRRSLHPLLRERLPFAFFIIPVLITAWRAGLKPAVFATLLGLLLGLCFLLEPLKTLTEAWAPTSLAVALYCVTAALIGWFAEVNRRTRSRAEARVAQLEAEQQSLSAELGRRQDVERDLERRLQESTAEVERLQRRLEEENRYLRQKERVSAGHDRIVGQSQALQRVLVQAEQVAATDATVLILGETGTGKELLAEFIHELSARKGRPLVSVNCAAIPGALVESELFGREKGAFTGSLSRQCGRFELADHSTIFLDEVGDLPLEVQVKLLRVLEAKQIERLGNPKPLTVDVRVIAATNRDLEKAVVEGKFRQDLYYRLNVFPLTVPPLRNRVEDIPLLVWAFVDEFAKRFNKNIESIERESMEALQRYAWPGNVRELRNLVERAMIVANGPKFRIHLPLATAAATPEPASTLAEVERAHILNALQQSGWRIRGTSGAAARLGLKPTTLEARMAKLGIRRPGSEETSPTSGGDPPDRLGA